MQVCYTFNQIVEMLSGAIFDEYCKLFRLDYSYHSLPAIAKLSHHKMRIITLLPLLSSQSLLDADVL